MGYENKVGVLGVKGWTISPNILLSLFYAAQEMFSERRDTVEFINHFAAGTVTTKWKKGGVLNVFGYLFTAKLKLASGQESEVTFVCREVDITKTNANTMSFEYGDLGWKSFNMN